MSLWSTWEEVKEFLEKEKFLKKTPQVSKEEWEKLCRHIQSHLPPRKQEVKPKKEESSSSHLKVFTDGASRGNPGPAGIGVVICDQKGVPLWEEGEAVGKMTNNMAEYRALLKGIEKSLEFHPQKVDFYLDSQLVVNQMKGIYRVKNLNIRSLYEKCKELLQKIPDYQFHHVPREENRKADALANQGIEQGL